MFYGELEQLRRPLLQTDSSMWTLPPPLVDQIPKGKQWSFPHLINLIPSPVHRHHSMPFHDPNGMWQVQVQKTHGLSLNGCEINGHERTGWDDPAMEWEETDGKMVGKIWDRI